MPPSRLGCCPRVHAIFRGLSLLVDEVLQALELAAPPSVDGGFLALLSFVLVVLVFVEPHVAPVVASMDSRVPAGVVRFDPSWWVHVDVYAGSAAWVVASLSVVALVLVVGVGVVVMPLVLRSESLAP